MTGQKFSRCSNIDSVINRSVWAIIPVRGGSKRLERKNIMPFAGTSLTRRVVETARRCGRFCRVLVTTDDQEIAEEAKSAGAEVPFLRPASLATDTASSLDTLLHAFEYMLGAFPEDKPEAVGLLQATSPLLQARHLNEAVDVFFNGDFNSLSSMKRVTQHPEWMFYLDTVTRQATPESRSGIVSSAAELKKRFIENGAVYLVKTSWLAESKSIYDFDRHGCYEMSVEDSIDIDTRPDWDYAEFMFEKRQKSG